MIAVQSIVYKHILVKLAVSAGFMGLVGTV